MATSPRKTIKSNPLDSIVTSRAQSAAPVAAKKAVTRRVKPDASLQAAQPVLPVGEMGETLKTVTKPRRQRVQPAAAAPITVFNEVATEMPVQVETPSSTAPKSSETVTASPTASTLATTPAEQNAESAQSAQSALTAEEVLEREFSPSSAMVMVPSSLFDHEDRFVDVHALHTVKTWSQWAVLAGLIPTPVIDTVAISAVQIKMIHALCKLYNVQFKKEAALAVVSGLVGGSLTTTLAGMGGVILSNLPGIGSFMKYTAQPALSYASTYALGRVFMRHFEENGTMIDMDSKKLEIYFKEQYAKGRKMFKYDFKTRKPQAV